MLIHLLMTVANNAKALKPALPKYIRQLFRHLIHIYVNNPKASSDNVVLVRWVLTSIENPVSEVHVGQAFDQHAAVHS